MDSISETAQSMGNTGERTKFKNLNQDHSSEHEWREREKEARRADTLAVLEGAVEVFPMMNYLLNELFLILFIVCCSF